MTKSISRYLLAFSRVMLLLAVPMQALHHRVNGEHSNIGQEFLDSKPVKNSNNQQQNIFGSPSAPSLRTALYGAISGNLNHGSGEDSILFENKNSDKKTASKKYSLWPRLLAFSSESIEGENFPTPRLLTSGTRDTRMSARLLQAVSSGNNVGTTPVASGGKKQNYNPNVTTTQANSTTTNDTSTNTNSGGTTTNTSGTNSSDPNSGLITNSNSDKPSTQVTNNGGSSTSTSSSTSSNSSSSSSTTSGTSTSSATSSGATSGTSSLGSRDSDSSSGITTSSTTVATGQTSPAVTSTTSTDYAKMLVNALSDGSYLFNVYNYQPAIVSLTQQTIDTGLSYNNSLTKVTERLSGTNQVLFDLPDDTGVVEIDFDHSCLFPVLGVSIDSTPTITINNGMTPSTFSLVANKLGISGFNTGQTTSLEVNRFNDTFSDVAKTGVYYQSVNLGNILKPEKAKAIAFCPFFVQGGSTDFIFTVTVTQRARNLNTTLDVYDTNSNLKNPSNIIFVPYAGSNLITISATPESCTYRLNTTSDLTITLVAEYVQGGVIKRQTWDRSGVGAVTQMPADSPISILISNSNPQQSFILNLTIESADSKTNTTAIVVGVVVPIVVLLILLGIGIYCWRRKRRQFVSSPDEENPMGREGLLLETNPNYVPIYEFNPLSKGGHDSSFSANGKRFPLGPSLSDEGPDSQKTLQSYETNERHVITKYDTEQAKIQIYTLKLDEFHENQDGEDIENILRQTKEKSEE